MKYKKVFWAALLVMILAMGGCSKENIDNNVSDIAGETTPTVTVTPTPTESLRNPNPLNLNGFRLNEGEAFVDEAGNVRLLATLESNITLGDKAVFDVGVIFCDEEYILIKYVLAENYEDYIQSEDCEQHLTLLTADGHEIVKDMKMNGSYYIKRMKNIFFYEEYTNDNTWKIHVYDYGLNEKNTFDVSGAECRYLTADGNRCYYMLGKKIYVMDGEKDVVQEVAMNENISINYLFGVISDSQNADYLIMGVLASDYNTYEIILDVSTGKSLFAQTMDDKYSSVENNMYMEYILEDMYPNQWLVHGATNKILDFQWEGLALEMAIDILNNQDFLFSYVSDGRMYLFLYGAENGNLKASTSVEVTDFFDTGYSEEFGGPGERNVVFVSEVPIYRDEKNLLVPLGNVAGEKFWLRWSLSVDEKDAENMIVTEHAMGTIPSVDISSMKNPLYTPGELRDSLKPLRERADELEEKYGVDIFIGEECANVLGGYEVRPLVDYYILENALSVLDTQMEMYPDNFFGQFAYGWSEGLDIYMASTLKGVEDWVLDYAGGFKTVYDSNILLVLDCTDTHGMPSTFHHELCHVIEEKLWNHSYSQKNPMFDEAKWSSMNPEEGMYSYDYADEDLGNYMPYLYEVMKYGTGEVQNTYFVDAYALTYPSEDRARLFESAMSDVLFDVEFEEAPHLREKLNYLAKCIRDVFDTSGWTDVPWEAYIE